MKTRKESSYYHGPSKEYDKILATFAHLLTDEALHPKQPIQDPFEHYVHHLYAKFHENSSLYADHFVHGYHVLMEELERMRFLNP